MARKSKKFAGRVRPARTAATRAQRKSWYSEKQREHTKAARDARLVQHWNGWVEDPDDEDPIDI